MHYDDEFVLNNNIFSFVIYKHEICGSENNDDQKYCYQLCSLQQCFLFNKRDVSKVLRSFSFKKDSDQTWHVENLIPELKEVPLEEFWLVSLINIENKEKNKNNCYRNFTVKSLHKADYKENFLLLH